MKKYVMTMSLVLCLVLSMAISAGAISAPEDNMIETTFTTSTGVAVSYFGTEKADICERDSCVYINGQLALDLTENEKNCEPLNTSEIMRVPSSTWNLANGAKTESGSLPKPSNINDLLKHYSKYKYKPKGSSITYNLNAKSMYVSQNANLFGIGLCQANGSLIQTHFYQTVNPAPTPVLGQWLRKSSFKVTSSGSYCFQYVSNVKNVNYTITYQ